jgi:hypothetical protein
MLQYHNVLEKDIITNCVDEDNSFPASDNKKSFYDYFQEGLNHDGTKLPPFEVILTSRGSVIPLNFKKSCHFEYYIYVKGLDRVTGLAIDLSHRESLHRSKLTLREVFEIILKRKSTLNEFIRFCADSFFWSLYDQRLRSWQCSSNGIIDENLR